MTLIADIVRNMRTPKYVVKQMSKNSRFRRPFHKQHGKRGQKLLKVEPHQFLVYLLTTLQAIELEKISLSDMQSLLTH